MGESRTILIFRVVEKVAVPVLLGTTLNDRSIKSIHPAEWKIVSIHTPPVSIPKIHEALVKPRVMSQTVARIMIKTLCC